MMNSSCPNCTTVPPVQGSNSIIVAYERIAQITLHTFIFVGGMLGNVFVATVILRRKKMRTVTNWFVFNLALSDIAIIVIIIPITNAVPFISWPFGEISCKYLIMPVMEHFAGVCVLTHTALGLARFFTVNNAMSGKTLNMTHVKVTIGLIWAIAFGTMSLTLMGLFGYFKLMVVNGKLICSLVWISYSRQIAYRVVVFVLTYVIPMVATGFAYFRIHKTVSKSIKHLHGHISEEVLTTRRRKSRRMNRVLMTMYVVFGITTLPLQVFYLANDAKLIPKHEAAQVTWILLVALFYFQVVSNPLVLFYMGEEYRKEFYRLPVCICAPRPKLRRLSYVVRGSFKGVGSHFKQRKSNVLGKSTMETESDNSKTRLMNGEKRTSTPYGSKTSDDVLFHPQNGYGGNNLAMLNSTNNLQTATYIPTVYAESSKIQFNGYIADSEADVNILPNETLQVHDIDDNASSYLYNTSDSQGDSLDNLDTYYCHKSDESCQIRPVEKLANLKNELDITSDTIFSTPKYRKVDENFDELFYPVNLETKLSAEEDDRKNSLQTSREPSVSAYYDDGTLLYFYDPNVGLVSFENDNGRETAI